MLVQAKLGFVGVAEGAVGVECFMHGFEVAWVTTEVIGELVVVHFPDFVFGEFHVVQLVVVEVKVTLSHDVLLVLFIGKLIVHGGLVGFSTMQRLLLHHWILI